jgi:general secretion pathway protein D
MEPSTALGRWHSWFVFLVLLLLSPPALAQTNYPPQPKLLTDVTLQPSPSGGTRILLTFSPQAPKYSVLRNDTAQPAIAFALSSRGMSAKVPASLGGLLRGVNFDQEDTILILNFAVNGTAHLTPQQVSDTVISLDVNPVSGPSGSVAAAGAPAPLAKRMLRSPEDDGFAVIPLKYADVSEVVGLLTEGVTVDSNDNFTPREPAFGSASVNGSGGYTPPPPGIDNSQKPLAQSVDDSIAIDRRLNAVIVKGSAELIARTREKIAKIDVPVQSVILETIFVELTETGAKNVGLDFNNANSQIATGTIQTGAFIPFGSTNTSANHALYSGQLQAAIYAQIQKGRGRIVSKPRIAAPSGGSAKIITGDALPILTAITLSGVNGVSQQVQYVNVGVTLQIAPRVTDDDFVSSHVFCVVSSVTGFSQGYPTISQREAQTSATVHDGETFVIGGLTQEDDIENNSKVPLLGDVPVLDKIFGLDKNTSSKTDLYIVITPHIVRQVRAAESSPPAGMPSAPDAAAAAR